MHIRGSVCESGRHSRPVESAVPSTRRARRIMGICGRQVAKLYREARTKERTVRTSVEEFYGARGLTSIKPSKSCLSPGGLILLFNACSLFAFVFFSLPPSSPLSPFFPHSSSFFLISFPPCPSPFLSLSLSLVSRLFFTE